MNEWIDGLTKQAEADYSAADYRNALGSIPEEHFENGSLLGDKHRARLIAPRT
ncbi:MAG: hypothetical protein JOZ73_12900 [Solirubrobacterales bacterium]|nr:hypothetical protein [Solirubrobacterales bacterium]